MSKIKFPMSVHYTERDGYDTYNETWADASCFESHLKSLDVNGLPEQFRNDFNKLKESKHLEAIKFWYKNSWLKEKFIVSC